MKHRYLPEILLTAAMIFYGTSFVATKFALEVYNTITIVTVRKLLAAGMLAAALFIQQGKKGFPSRQMMPPLVLIAVFQPFLYFISETYGISMVEASLAAIIIATLPVFTPLIAGLFFDEKLNRYNYLGVVLSAAGVALIVLTDRSDDGTPVRLLGVLLLFGAVFANIGYSIVVKKTSPGLSSLTITTMQNCFGAAMLLPLFAALEFSHAAAQPVSWLPLASIIYLAIFPSSLAFIFMTYGIRAIGPTRAMVFTNLVPLVTALLSLSLLQEAFTVYKVAGMAVILSGVMLSQRGSAKVTEEVLVDR